MRVLGWFLMVVTAGDAAAEKGPAPRSEGAPASIDVRSEVGDELRFVEARFFVDGAEVAHRRSSSGAQLDRVFRLWSSTEAPMNEAGLAFSGALPAGRHAMTVEVLFEGRNLWPFTYLESYRYRVNTNFTVTIEPNSLPVNVQASAAERAGTRVGDRDKVVLSVRPGPGSGAVPVLDPRPRRN
jgi:hypothetical protein